ncbi:hypothetical protein N7488_009315 [Penicillium malachiteum]|nr:hypothetical protein N7488_009315 [Penicillium malachiteum]
MRQIYTQAKRVITYLGPAGLEAEEMRGIKLLKEIYETIPHQAWGQIHEAGSLEQIRDLILDGSIQPRQLPRDLEFEAGKLYDEDEISKRYTEQGWDWVLGVAYSEVNQRLWIVQEQLLNEIIMLCGPRLIDWDIVLAIPILFAVGHLPQQYHEKGRINTMDESSLSWDKVEEILYHQAHFHADNSVLAVKGQVLDYVSTSDAETTYPLNENPSVPSLFRFLYSIEYLLRDGFSIEDILSLLRTITAKGPWSPPPDPQTSSSEAMIFHFWAYLRYKLRSLSDSLENSAFKASLLSRFDMILTELQRIIQNFTHDQSQHFTKVTEIENVASDRVSRHALEQGRYVGRTRSGRFFNAMNTMHKVDSIAALQGADRLSVIRRTASAYRDGNVYKFVGDIFVDGLMDEEAYENQDPDPDLVDHEIELE